MGIFSWRACSTLILCLAILGPAEKAPAASAVGCFPEASGGGASSGLSGPPQGKKREGRYFNGLPAVAYSPELGFILAGMAGFYNNGRRDDGFFSITPYRTALTILASASTRGMASLQVIGDAPYFLDSAFRVRARIYFSRNPVETYFGTGETTMGQLSAPDGRAYSSYADYYDDLLRIRDGSTNAYFDYYLSRLLLGEVLVERNLSRFFRAAAGLTVSRHWIHDYTRDFVPGVTDSGEADREDAVMGTTRLRADYESGLIYGFEGGMSTCLRLGMAFDSRDLEPFPRRGMFHDLLLTWSPRFLGSDSAYSITCLTTRFYASPFPDALDLVLAARLGLVVKSGEVPFYKMNSIPSTDRSVIGLGGEYTLRGFRLSRFSGPVFSLGNLEARLIFASFALGADRIELAAVPFLDFGRVHDRLSGLSLKGLKLCGGLGLRAVVSQSFVVSMDVGFSAEESFSIYMTYGQIF
jgi:hypothetical protein